MIRIKPRIGTAGWSVSARYKEDVTGEGSHLERYARRFNAVEINTSFYRPHQRKTYERWAASTPENFKFSVKMPRSITHEHRLVDCRSLLDRFIAEVTGLGGKLGVLLVQLPPSLVFDERAAGDFFRDLHARVDTPVAFEPRHPSWFDPGMDAWLAERRIARVAADPAPVFEAGTPGGWSGLVYYRWHGSPRIYYSEYDAAALAAFERRIVDARARDISVWCIFDNTAEGAALGNALTLARAFE